MNQLHPLIAAVCGSLVAFGLIGCESDGEVQTETDPVVFEGDEEAELLTDEAMRLVNLDMGDAQAVLDADNGEIVYQDGEYTEIKSENGRRLVVVKSSLDDRNMAKAMEGEVGGEIFTVIGRGSPVPQMTIKGDAELKEAFYKRWNLTLPEAE
jgi:hypothetical protein